MSSLGDDLDLSSLDAILGDDDVGPVNADADAAADEPSEELSLDLGDDSASEAGAAESTNPEIDLSEIEKMLEEPEGGGAKFSAVPEQDLDLDIEASLETEKWMSESNEDGKLVADEELDLSELEQVLEDVDTDESDETLDDPELDLGLGDGASLGTAGETVAAGSELDFDLSEFEDEASDDAEGADRQASADMELEFEVEADSHAKQTFEDEELEETVAVPDTQADAAGAAAKPPELTKPASRPKPVKKGASKSLIFLLVLVILGGGGYGTYYLLNQNGIEIPFLSDYLKPKVQDPGNLKLTTYDINSRFVENGSVGKLFVVSGKVKNGYADNRGMITLIGKIFSTGKVAVQQQRVYAGNILSDLELANLEWDKIQARLSNRLGDNRSNVKIEPGKSIPFMVVFSGLPDDLEEFTIEVTGSTSLK